MELLCIPVSNFCPANFTDVFIFISAVIKLILGFHNTSAYDVSASTFGIDDISYLNLIDEFPRSKAVIHVGSLKTINLTHLFAHCFAVLIFAKVTQFFPTKAHDAIMDALVPLAGILSRRVHPNVRILLCYGFFRSAGLEVAAHVEIKIYDNTVKVFVLIAV